MLLACFPRVPRAAHTDLRRHLFKAPFPRDLIRSGKPLQYQITLLEFSDSDSIYHYLIFFF